jgi:nucleotide-binding universal stress UspA family protein
MSLKHVLVHVDDAPNAAVRNQVAVALARAHEAHLSGLYVLPETTGRQSAVSGVSTQLSPQFLADQQERMRELADRSMNEFVKAAESANVPADHRIESNGAVAETIAERARCADLTLLGKPNGDGASLVHDVLFASGGPVMIVPAAAGETCGERVMIAWNGSRESARAVKDAFPILEKAQSVSVVCVNGRNWPRNTPAGAEVVGHLAHHGIASQIDNLEASGLSVGDALLARAAEKSADLLVMGAYGHSRIREFVLGGVTKRMLQNATVPVLMSH